MVVLAPNQHLGVWGRTNSGKTFAAKKLHTNHATPLALFVNFQAEDVPGWETVNPPSMKDLVIHKTVVWTGDPNKMVEQLDPLVSKLFALGRAFGPSATNRQKPVVSVAIDEAFAFGGLQQVGALTRLCAQGLRHGIVVTLCSQRPQNVEASAFRQLPQHILFAVNPPELDYLNHNIAPIPPEGLAWLQRPYHPLYYRDGTWTAIAPF